MSDALWMSSGARSVKIWQRPSFEEVLEWKPPSGNVSDLAVSSDGLFLATASDSKEIYVLFEGDDAQYRIVSLQHQENHSCVGFNPAAPCQLACGGKDGVVKIWDVKSQKLLKKLHGHCKPITGLVYNCKGTHVASACGTGEILIHNVTTSEKSATLKLPKPQSVSCIKAHNLSQGTLGSVTDYGHCHLWDSHHGRLVHTFKSLHSAPAKGLVFSPINDILMVTCGLDKTASFLDSRTKMSIKKLTLADPLVSVDLLSNGLTLALGTMTGRVFVFDLRNTTSPLHTVDSNGLWVAAVRFQCMVKQTAEATRKDLTARGSVPVSEMMRADEPKPTDMQRFVKDEVFSPLEFGGDHYEISIAPGRKSTHGPEDICASNIKDEVFSPIVAFSEDKPSPGIISVSEMPEEISPIGDGCDNPSREVEKEDFGVQVGEASQTENRGTQTDAVAMAPSTTVGMDVNLVKKLVKEAVDEVWDNTREATMELRVDIARFFVDHQMEMERLIRHQRTVDENVLERVALVLEENAKLRQQLRLA